MQKEEIKVELTINGVSVKVGHKFLEDISRDIPDVKENKKIFSLLALSNNHEVRENISSNEFLSKVAINILLKDESDEIIDNILSNRDTNKYITDVQMVEVIQKDNVKLLSTIANNINEFQSCNICKIIKKLANHKSSKVKYSLFSYGVSDLINVEILKKLAYDKDSDVAFEARKELKERDIKNTSWRKNK